MKIQGFRIFVAAVCVFVVGAGCAPAPAQKHPEYVRAKRAIDGGDYAAAARSLERVLQVRPDARVHLELAQLYDEQLQDPFPAVGHYMEFLRLSPDSPDFAMVDALCRRARREALDAWLIDPETLPPEPVLDGDPGRLQRELVILRRENSRLRREIAMLEKAASTPVPAPVPTPAPVAAAPAAAPSAVSAPVPDRERSYTVESGDTPAKISKKMYGTTRYANLILVANRDTVKTERGLQIGQVLRIPPKPEE